jgi:hypothetical protein
MSVTSAHWTVIGRMVSAIIGATLALWLLSGDHSPEGMQLPVPEGAFGRNSEMPAVVGMTGDAVFTVTVKAMDTFDFNGTEFYQLFFGNGTFVVISTDKDLPLAAALRTRNGQKVSLSLTGQ